MCLRHAGDRDARSVLCGRARHPVRHVDPVGAAYDHGPGLGAAMSRAPHFLRELAGAGADARYVLTNARTGAMVANHVEGAFDSKSRRRGLLGRDGLDPGAVLIIAPCESVHTFFMRFAIDVVFVDRAGQIVKICPHVKPWRIALALGAFATLEFAAGAFDRAGTRVGDRLVVAPPTETHA